MRKFLFVFICCILICVGAYRFCDFKVKDGTMEMKEMLYEGVCTFFMPQVALGQSSAKQLAYMGLERMMFPALNESRNEGKNAGSGGKDTEGIVSTEDGQETESQTEEDNSQTQDGQTTEEDTETIAGVPGADTKKVVINREKLNDFDYLRQNFYQVDNTTTVDSTILDITKLLGTDVTLSDNTEGPQVLIYHTHSQEGYVGWEEGDASSSVLAIGDYLEELLTEMGFRVLHHKGEYDVGDRDHAYSNSLPSMEQLIADNPSIEVVIDLHRDGVPDNLHLVTDVDGRQTAQIMFFVGMSRSTSQGELTSLPNPYIDNNLALSFQLQMAADEYYPGLARNIYLKCYRYNQHICSKCILVEVGAQTNSFEEAKNAMIPLADILNKVLRGK